MGVTVQPFNKPMLIMKLSLIAVAQLNFEIIPTFTASELVDWLVEAGSAEDRSDGVKLGQVCVCCHSNGSGDAM